MKNEDSIVQPKKKDSRLGEIFRFVVIGGLCTVIDFVVEYLLGLAFAGNLSRLGSTVVGEETIPGYGSYLSLSICVALGFAVSMVVNFFFSRKWVFQDVDKNTNYNTPKYFWTYAGFAFGGLVLGIGIQCLCSWIVNEIWNMNLSLDPFQKVDWGKLFHKDSLSFWAFFAVFCIKTLIVLIYNYWTRKLFIFKAPKPTAVVDKASTSINDKVIMNNYRSEPTLFSELAPVPEKDAKNGETKEEKTSVTAIQEQEVTAIEKEETPKPIPTNENVDTIYGKPQFHWGKRLTKKNVKELVYSSLEVYDKRKTPVTNKGKAKEIIVDTILEEDEKKKRGIDDE